MWRWCCYPRKAVGAALTTPTGCGFATTSVCCRFGQSFNSLPPFISVFLHVYKTEHLKFFSRGINKMIQARTDHQVSAGLCKLHYFNAVAPCDSSTGRGTKISTKAGPTVNSIHGVIDDTTCRSRTTIRRLCDSCIDVLRLGSVIVDG